MQSAVKSPKKLIEVALPLDAINFASAREKSIRHGHPSTLHLWWARRPLATARAVIFAQMVNDPGGERGYFAGMTKVQADVKREELFKIIEDLVKWENTNNEEVLSRARAAIADSWRDTCRLNKNHPRADELFNPELLPGFHDPFAGGGALPLEAQRLGLETFASDLNPVAVTINKAMIEIPPKFEGRAPVGSKLAADRQARFADDWRGTKGLSEDIRRYGAWMLEQAIARIGQYYPKIEVTAEMASDRGDLRPLQGQQLTVIAWLWARTVRSPNPAFGDAYVPLVSTFVLSSKDGKQSYVHPVVDGSDFRFEVRTGTPPAEASEGTKVSRGAFRCLFSDAPIKYEYVDDEANAGRMGARLMAIVAEGARGRVYLAPTAEHEAIAQAARPEWKPDTACRGTFASNAQGRYYGFKVFGDYFTARQLLTLTTFCELMPSAIARVRSDALDAGMSEDGIGLDDGGIGAQAYAEAVGVYLAFAIEKLTETHSSLCTWSNAPKNELVVSTFRRQGLPMTWDFGEANPFADSSGSFAKIVEAVARVLPTSLSALRPGRATQEDAQTQVTSSAKVVSTDPPYYDNIGYADLSDYFYVWLRKSLRPIFPSLYATLAVPKAEELVATPYRHGGKSEAEAFFLDGMTRAMHNLAARAHPAFPVTIYYAFKQSDTQGDGITHSTGWETFLDAVLRLVLHSLVPGPYALNVTPGPPASARMP